jgi:ribosomal protein L37E
MIANGEMEGAQATQAATKGCGPYTCDFPETRKYNWREKWTCTKCGTTYVRAMRVPEWAGLLFGYVAPHGFWTLGRA